MIKNDDIHLIINTPSGKTPREDEVKIRSLAVARRIPILTTVSGVEASIRAMRSIQTKGLAVKSLQEYVTE
jgi:carbamoyl-phosphate synthase large subunit